MNRARLIPNEVLYTGAGLLALWALTFALSYVSLGAASMPIALVIALAKAVLVVTFFMELVRERASIKVTFAAALGLAVILLGLTVADVETRDRAPLVVPGAESPAGTAELPSR